MSLVRTRRNTPEGRSRFGSISRNRTGGTAVWLISQSQIEDRNAADKTIRQYVWGMQYIDDLVQIGTNDDPSDGSEQACETTYWGLEDANSNLLGIVASDGSVKERYEYTPYGQRTVYKSAGSDDALCMSPILESQRVLVSGIAQAYGICDVGHQGLFFDKELGLYDNRTRPYHSVFARFPVRDLAGYADGMNLHEYACSNPAGLRDPRGSWGQPTHDTATFVWAAGFLIAPSIRTEIGRADNKVDEDHSIASLHSRQSYQWHVEARNDASNALDWDIDRIKPWQSDLRSTLSNAQMNEALMKCVRDGDAHGAAKALGTGLHPLQDYYAHGNWSGALGWVHPAGFDNPTLDYSGLDGVPVMSVDGTNGTAFASARQVAGGSMPEGVNLDEKGHPTSGWPGTRRITATQLHTKRYLAQFINIAWFSAAAGEPGARECLCNFLVPSGRPASCGGSAVAPPGIPPLPAVAQRGYVYDGRRAW